MSKLTELIRDVREMKISVDRVENILETRLIGVDRPYADEIRANREYEKLKASGKVDYVPLAEVSKSLGIRRTSRKARR